MAVDPKWMSGKEIMEQYRFTAEEIGKACYDGKLQPYLCADDAYAVYDISQSLRVPKFPPLCVKDKLKYAKKAEGKVRWEWCEILADEGYTDKFGPHPGIIFAARKYLLKSRLFRRNEPRECSCWDELREFSERQWRVIYDAMCSEFVWYIEGQIKPSDGSEISERLMYFDFDMFYRAVNGWPISCISLWPQHKRRFSIADALGEYRKRIAGWLFKGEHISAWRLAPADVEEIGTKEKQGSVGEDTRVAVDVSPALWAGLTHDVAFKNLKDKGFGEVIIAFILCKKMECKKTKLGRMLYHDPKDKNSEKDNSTYLRKVDKLLTDCDNSYILSFPE
jgi:hypothetical protein